MLRTVWYLRGIIGVIVTQCGKLHFHHGPLSSSFWCNPSVSSCDEVTRFGPHPSVMPGGTYHLDRHRDCRQRLKCVTYLLERVSKVIVYIIIMKGYQRIARNFQIKCYENCYKTRRQPCVASSIEF